MSEDSDHNQLVSPSHPRTHVLDLKTKRAVTEVPEKAAGRALINTSYRFRLWETLWNLLTYFVTASTPPPVPSPHPFRIAVLTVPAFWSFSRWHNPTSTQLFWSSRSVGWGWGVGGCYLMDWPSHATASLRVLISRHTPSSSKSSKPMQCEAVQYTSLVLVRRPWPWAKLKAWVQISTGLHLSPVCLPSLSIYLIFWTLAMPIFWLQRKYFPRPYIN